MKSIGNILLYIFAFLAAASGVYVIATPGSLDPEVVWDPNKGAVSMIIWITLIALFIAFLLFVVYKVVDVIKHPAHMGEAIRVFGAVLVALVIGFIFSGSEDIVFGTGEVFDGGMTSKLIGTGIIATLTLLIIAILYMVYDTVIGLFKS